MACPIQARRREYFSFEVKIAGIKQITGLKASAASGRVLGQAIYPDLTTLS
jgi:hypothetical protein